MTQRIGVIGSGSWGTALAIVLAPRFSRVDLWARDVPMFLPRLVPAGPRSTRFDWGRVRVNREWRTAAALPLLGLVLLVRGRLPF